MSSTTVGNARDASTAGTRSDAFATAEDNAVTSARRYTEQARDVDAQAGVIADKPDMADAYDRLRTEASNLRQTAETRTGLARGFNFLRRSVGL